MATAILELEKNPIFGFSLKWQQKLLPVPILSADFDFSHPVSVYEHILDVYLQVLLSLSDQQFRRSDLVISPTKRQFDDFSQVVRPVILQPCQRCKRNSARL